MKGKISIVKAAGLLFLVLGLAVAFQSFAITGPSAGAGVGSGAISVDSSNNLSVGGATASSVKFQVIGVDATSNNFGLKVMPSSGSTANLSVRNDGVVTFASTTYAAGSICFGSVGATDCASSWSGLGGGGVTSTPAGYITPGYFNSIAGTGGNYSFPASLSIGTSTAPSGGVLFVNGNVGIGTSAPNAPLIVGRPLSWSAAFVAAGFKAPVGQTSTFIALEDAASTAQLGLSINSTEGYVSANGDLSMMGQDTVNFKTFDAGVGYSTKLRMLNNGNVGIGTTAPAYPLDVVGGSFATGTIRTSQGIRFGTNGLSAAPVLFAYDGSTLTTPNPAGRGLGFYSYSITGGDVGVGFSGENVPITSGIYTNVAFNRGFAPTSGTGAYTNLNLTGAINQTGGANGTSRGIYINPTLTSAADWHSLDMANNSGYGVYQSGASALNYFAGNVGIATTTPGSPLTVAGTIYSSTGGYKFPDGTTQTTAATGGSGTNYFTLSGASLYPTSTAYNVGIGTVSPSSKLDVTSDVDEIMRLTRTGAANPTLFNQGTDGVLVINNGHVNTLTLSSGNVGIGTTNPQFSLDIFGTTNKLGITYSYSGAYGSTGAELNADSNGDLHIVATKRGPSTTIRNILLADNGGKVGIATTTPGSPLTVDGVIYSATGGYKFPDGTTQTTAATGGGSGTNYFTLSGASLYPTSTAYNAGFGTASLDANYKITTAGGGIKAESTTQPAGYFNSSSGYGLIVNTGYVGIGTTAPATQLQVGTISGGYLGDLTTPALGLGSAANGFYIDGNRLGVKAGNAFSGMFTSTQWIAPFGDSATPGIAFNGDPDTGISNPTSTNTLSLSTAGVSRMYILPTGEVGIGTTAPVTKLQVVGGGITLDNNQALFFKGSGGSNSYWQLFNNTDDTLYVIGNSATRMVIKNDGSVGIATTTPGSPLTVAGTIYSSTGGFKFPDGTTQTTAATGGGGGGGYGWTTSGTSVILATSTNYVGIGTTTPAYPFVVVNSGIISLQVASSTITVGGGTGKINVGTVDPPYTISGEQFATYVPAMTGQKEETTGEIGLTCDSRRETCSTSIEFGKVEKGSDLWLFAKTTNLKNNFSKMTVLLTPSFDGKVWYEKDVINNVLKIFASPVISDKLSVNSYSVSYRLTAPRFDSVNWLNTRNEPGVNGFVIND